MTLAPGVIFGESAMLEGGMHSVTAIAEDEIVLYSLSRRNLEAIRLRNPDLYRRFAQHVCAPVGAAADDASILRDASDSVE